MASPRCRGDSVTSSWKGEHISWILFICIRNEFLKEVLSFQKEWLDQFEKAKKGRTNQEHPKRETLSNHDHHPLVTADSVESSSNRKYSLFSVVTKQSGSEKNSIWITQLNNQHLLIGECPPLVENKYV